MNKRTPLAQREVVQPVNLYTNRKEGKGVNNQTGKPSIEK